MSCLSSYYLKAWSIDANADLETEQIKPSTLLTANRLDIVCKLYYIDCIEKGKDVSYAKELYRAHIEAFSDGAYIEPGLKTKNSILDYFDSFDRLIADIKKNGFDPSRSLVPVGEDGSILDGSHRAAIAIYYDIPISVVHVPVKARNYDYAFFRERGMSEDYLDFMAYLFILFSDPIYTVCLWPAAYDKEKLADADQMIRNCASIAYRKEVFLNYRGIEQLMISFYKSMGWTGSLDNGYSGVASKARECYKPNAPTTVYVVGGAELDKILELKQRIRDLYAIENASVHITDTHSEAAEAGKMLLNRNSVDFMNYGDPFRNKSFIKDFVKRTEEGQPCAGSGTTLSLYGIGDQQSCDSRDLGEALLRPEDCFYFWGVRLPSLDYIKAEMKRSGAEKDLDTVKRIESFERKKRSIFTDASERAGNLLRSASGRIALKWKDVREGSKRKAKVVYHRMKYKKQCTGEGKKDVTDLQKAFLDINTTTADYLIMRNWEGFYDDILLEGHNDIDLLCRDKDSRDIIVRLLDAKPLTPDGFHYSFKHRGREVTLDTRIVGDGYYDRRWQREMLKSKRLHPLGFYVMDPENYFYSLIYHAVYQKKNVLSEEYSERLNRMSPVEETWGQDDFAVQLDLFMKKNRYAYTDTMDKSVVKAFSNTQIRKKKRYPLNIRLCHIAQKIKEKQLLQKMKIRVRKLLLRGK